MKLMVDKNGNTPKVKYRGRHYDLDRELPLVGMVLIGNKDAEGKFTRSFPIDMTKAEWIIQNDTDAKK